jgi:hypothetical protein
MGGSAALHRLITYVATRHRRSPGTLSFGRFWWWLSGGCAGGIGQKLPFRQVVTTFCRHTDALEFKAASMGAPRRRRPWVHFSPRSDASFDSLFG